MITLLLVISAVCIIPCIIILIKTYDDFDSPSDVLLTIGITVFALGIVICGIWDITLATDVATERILDSKIEMYQEENARIEQSIDTLVKSYLQHERDTFKDLKTDESPITLVTLFPELKSDALMQQQMEIYVANNQTIKSLREQKIEIARKKWLLNFGG